MTKVRRLSGWRAAGIAVGAVAAPAMASAADLPAPTPATAAAPAAYVPPVPDWIVTIGAEVRIGPKWAGAPDGKFGLTGGPLFSIRRVGTPPDYFGPRDSFGFPIVDLGQFKLGPAVQIVWQRKASSDTALNGLGDVNFAVQAGAFAEYWPVQWRRLPGELRQGFGGGKGCDWRLGCGRRGTGGTVALFGRPAFDGAVDGRRQSLFQHHAGSSGGLDRRRAAGAAGLSC